MKDKKKTLNILFNVGSKFTAPIGRVFGGAIEKKTHRKNQFNIPIIVLIYCTHFKPFLVTPFAQIL